MQDHHYDLYKKIVYRSLVFERTPDIMGKFEEFIREVREKSSLINTKKKTKKLKKDKRVQESGLFCPDLIVTAYKIFGVLHEDAVSDNYCAGNFANKRQIELIKGNLGPELLIDITLA